MTFSRRRCGVFLPLLTFIILCADVGAAADVWLPRFAGRFYPAEAGELKSKLGKFLGAAPAPNLKGAPFAIIAPHAGYHASGTVAAHAFRAIADAGFTRAVVLAPSHRKSFRGVSVLDVAKFRTPLGDVSVDRDAVQALLADKAAKPDPTSGTSVGLILSDEGAYAREHSLEVELPFLQTVLGDFKLVPVVVGSLQGADFERIAAAIRPLLDPSTLLVVSSDFTHYGKFYGYEPFPKNDDTEKNIAALDKGAFEKILAKDGAGLWRHRLETDINTCGIMPILLGLKLLPGDAEGTLLNYDTSGHIGKDYSNSVSYASIAFTRPGTVVPLAAADKVALLNLARSTLDIFVRAGKYPGINEANLAKHPRLDSKEGVFVSLYKQGTLRGCIGTVGGQMPLYQGVMSNTASAATKDGRFTPVTPEELSEIRIEISVLSEPSRIAGPSAYDVKRDGMLIKKDGSRGVFLPGVASNFNWNLFITLRELCRKAGLPLDAWKDKAMEFYKFSSLVFGEENAAKTVP